VHLRRALILFAVVLGLAGLAAAVSKPGAHHGAGTSTSQGLPEATPAPQPEGAAPVRLGFSDRGKPRTQRLRVGLAATVIVTVHVAGDVELHGLGLTLPAEPLTPARFDVLASQPGRYAVRFTPAAQGATKTIGVLRVVAAPT
jgi:hypothetical protein